MHHISIKDKEKEIEEIKVSRNEKTSKKLSEGEGGGVKALLASFGSRSDVRCPLSSPQSSVLCGDLMVKGLS